MRRRAHRHRLVAAALELRRVHEHLHHRQLVNEGVKLLHIACADARNVLVYGICLKMLP